MKIQLETLKAKNGQPTLRACLQDGRKIYLHSAYNPEREAENWAQGAQFGSTDIILLFGCGVGYAPQALRRKLTSHNRLLMFDPLAGHQEFRHLDRTVSDPRIQLTRSFKEFVEAYMQIENRGMQGLRLLRIPSYEKLLPQELKQLAEWTARQVNILKLNRNTVFKMAQVWQRNLFANIAHLPTSGAVKSGFGRYKGKPAIIVSAGPSLAKNMHLLEEAADKALIIATGTAARPLAQMGLPYHLVLSVDPNPVNFEAHFRGVPHRRALLVYDVTTTPQVVSSHEGHKAAFYSLPDCQWLDRFFTPHFGLLQSGGSVANNAFSLALKLGADPIILIGQDLAYTDGRAHASGCFTDDYRHEVPDGWFEHSEEEARKLVEARPRFQNLLKKGRIAVPGVSGTPVWTDRILYGYLCWFEETIAQLTNRPRIIDATEGGAMIKGTEVASLETVLNECTVSASTEIESILNRLATPVSTAGTELEDYLRSRLEDLIYLQDRLEEALEMPVDQESEQALQAIESDVRNQLEKLKTFLHFAITPALVQIFELSGSTGRGSPPTSFGRGFLESTQQMLNETIPSLRSLTGELKCSFSTSSGAK